MKLKILGYFPDGDKLHELIGGAPQIEVLKARPHPEALRIISGAAILVLPSRCEGMGRVLIEGNGGRHPLDRFRRRRNSVHDPSRRERLRVSWRRLPGA